MTIPSLNGARTSTLLDGTLPVRPFHPDGFVGSLQADGQQVRVAALACDDERVIALSLVGFDTSIGVVLARLWSSTAVPFEPATTLQEEWQRTGTAQTQQRTLQAVRGASRRHQGSPRPGPVAHRTPHRRHPAPARSARDGRAVIGNDGGAGTRNCTVVEADKAAVMDTTLRPGQLG